MNTEIIPGTWYEMSLIPVDADPMEYLVSFDNGEILRGVEHAPFAVANFFMIIPAVPK